MKAGAEVTEDLSPAAVILGVKEVPIDQIMPDRTYVARGPDQIPLGGCLPFSPAVLQPNALAFVCLIHGL